MRRRLLSGGVWAFAGKIFTALAQLAATALLARLLSPRDMGAYFLAYSLVTVGSMIGFGGLGKMFTDGFQRDIPQEIVAGIVLVLLLALVVDGLLLLLGRALTPWTRVGAGAR